MPKSPLVLIIMDGYGISDNKEMNAIAMAKTPHLTKYFKEYPFTTLKCSGESVGLPPGLMGNSEVGHLNIGAGRIVFQDIMRITNSIKDNSFFKNKVLLDAINNAKKNNSSLHLMGLLSDGGVHSDKTHLYALLRLAKQNNLKKVYIHALLDGRDTPPRSALKYFNMLEKEIKMIGVGEVATICGRYYAMDRDKRWERIQKAYDAMVFGKGENAESAEQAVESAYQRNENDEFVLPTVITKNNQPKALVQEKDSFIFFNFRSDRARQITGVFIEKLPKLHFACMTQYEKDFNVPVVFSQEKLDNILSRVLSENKIRQLRIAETEKYAHVTFFFNGGVEKPFPLEDRVLISSPKIATYDLKPEMSAFEVTERVLKEIDKDIYDVIIMNFANCDMVGHTGIIKAAISAVEAVDLCVGKITDKVIQKHGAVLITADHGNAEKMFDKAENQPYTAHTINPVPFCFVSENPDKISLRDNGILADIAPTILEFLSIKKPLEMTGTSLLKDKL